VRAEPPDLWSNPVPTDGVIMNTLTCRVSAIALASLLCLSFSPADASAATHHSKKARQHSSQSKKVHKPTHKHKKTHS
jgi:hypothetical protein